MAEKYVIFRINDEYFAVKISQVLEIIYSQEVFKVPDVPSYVEGLINVRGSVYTLINMRKRLNIPFGVVNADEVKIFLVNINSMLVGFLVDNVEKIAVIDEENINFSTENITKYDKEFFIGTASYNDMNIYLMNLEALVESCRKAVV